MSGHDDTAATPHGNSLDHTVTASTVITVPEKAALSNATTVVLTHMDTHLDKSARGSSDSWHKSDRSANAFDTDLEAYPSNLELGNTQSGCRAMNPNRRSDCQVWPDQKTWKQKAKLAKMKRGCGCMAKMSRRNRIIFKIVIVLLVIGIGVGVGFGVSKPLNAPIWGNND